MAIAESLAQRLVHVADRDEPMPVALGNDLFQAGGLHPGDDAQQRAVFAPDTCTGNQQGKSKQAAGWSKSKRHYLHYDVQV